MNTSVKAYNEIVASGLLSKRQRQVYELMRCYKQGMTGAEINRIIKDGHKRLSELENKGAIEKTDATRKDEITNQTGHIWVVLESPALKKPCKPISKKLQLEIDKAYKSGYKAGFNDGRAVEIIGADF